MGMHFGILVADEPWDVFRPRLEARVGPLTDTGVVGDLAELSLEPGDDGFVVAGGERANRSYLMDSSFLLSGGADLIAALAADTGGLVVGCGAETVSGSFWLTAVRGAEVVRLYYQCASELDAILSEGRPFACEATCPLDDIDGGGLLAVLDRLGFELDAWAYSSAPKTTLLYPGEDDPVAGPLTARIDAFRAEHRLTAGPKRPGLLRRLFGRR